MLTPWPWGAQPGRCRHPARCHPGRQRHTPAGKHGITLALIKGLSALALLDKQDCAERIQQLGRGSFRHLSISTSPPVPCERPRHQRGPRAQCPPPAHRLPTALLPTPRHGQAPAGRIQPAKAGIRHQKAGRQEHGKPPPSVSHSRSFTYPCSARRSKQRPMAPISIFLPSLPRLLRR